MTKKKAVIPSTLKYLLQDNLNYLEISISKWTVSTMSSIFGNLTNFGFEWKQYLESRLV